MAQFAALNSTGAAVVITAQYEDEARLIFEMRYCGQLLALHRLTNKLPGWSWPSFVVVYEDGEAVEVPEHTREENGRPIRSIHRVFAYDKTEQFAGRFYLSYT
jgi:hypothetical protein